MDLREVFEDYCRFECEDGFCVGIENCPVNGFIREIESLELLEKRNEEHVVEG